MSLNENAIAKLLADSRMYFGLQQPPVTKPSSQTPPRITHASSEKIAAARPATGPRGNAASAREYRNYTSLD